MRVLPPAVRPAAGLRASSMRRPAVLRPHLCLRPQLLRPPVLQTAPAAARLLSTTRRVRAASPPPHDARPAPPPPKSFWQRHPVVKYTLLGFGSIGFGLTATVALILAYDFTTYHASHVGQVPVSQLALRPDTGGPKNLPVLTAQVDDAQDAHALDISAKEHLVVVGGGWGAVALLQTLDPDRYHVTVVSPTNYFLFTPLLPSAAVGTVEPRSLVEGLRRIIKRLDGHYIQGKAVDVVLPSQLDGSEADREKPTSGRRHLLEVAVVDAENNHGDTDSFTQHVYVPYDKLVIACGSTTNTHGVPGLENSYQLKTIEHVRGIRAKIVNNLEVASLPTTTPEERERLLSFVVCGGGPTGVETAAEIFDMMNEDVLRLYPRLIPAQVQVSVIQSREHILNTYSEKISQYAEHKFGRDGVRLITNSRVKAIHPDRVTYTVRRDDGTVEEFAVPSGFTLWSTGIAMNPFTRRLSEILPNQFHLKALMVDQHLRVKGSPAGSMYALGDAATMDNRLIDHLYEWVERHDRDCDGQLAYDEFAAVVADISREYPLATRHFEKLDRLFKEYDADHNDKLSVNELSTLLLGLQKNITSYPPTAQTASQQGKYLGKMLNAQARARDRAAHTDAGAARDVDSSAVTEGAAWEDELYPPFKFTNLGSLAYIGNAAAFDIPFLPEKVGQFAGGLIAMYVWRSFYLSEQVDSRTRLLLLVDYIKRGIWGRDLSRM